MSESGLSQLESILRLCEAAAPEAWYPRLFVKQSGVDPEGLSRALEELWLRGLIEKTPGTSESGPGIMLTREGQRVLLDPEALDRLRAGRPISSGDRAAIIRQALRGGMRPYVTFLLVLLNVLVFLHGYLDARGLQVDGEYLRGSFEVRGQAGEDVQKKLQGLKALYENSGILSAARIVEGQWWRLLTAGFVHFGFMHLLMNMACLYFAGRFIEQMWGHLRYLVIYLVALLGGSCLGVVHHVGYSAGASGAVCGILAAEAVWFLFNRNYLPRALLRQARTNFVVNLVLLVFISMFQNVSGWGHFGGAAAGALAALLMHLQRFGPAGWRWLALVGFLPMAWYGRHAIERARATDPQWQAVEQVEFNAHHLGPVKKALAEAEDVYVKVALPVLEKHPDRRNRRDENEVEKALAELTATRDKLQALDDDLDRAGPYFNPDVERERQQLRERIVERLRFFEDAAQRLRVGEKWQTPQEREQHEFESLYLRRTDTTLSTAFSLYRKKVRPVLDAAPVRRDAAAVEAAEAVLAEQRPLVDDLLAALMTAGPYQDETVEEGRSTARSYAAACAELLAAAEHRVKAGAKETDQDKQAVEQKEEQVKKWWQEWRQVVE